LLLGRRQCRAHASIDTEREHAASARSVFEEAGSIDFGFRLITGIIGIGCRKSSLQFIGLVVIRPAADLMDLIHASYRLLRPGGILFIDPHFQRWEGYIRSTQRDF
jgi:predicted O-methyltransferase YrrM